MIIFILYFRSHPKAVKYTKILFSTILIVLAIPISARSQTTAQYDSIDLAKNLMYSNRISDAIKILDRLDKSLPSNEHVLLLYSQALYWNNDYHHTLSYIKANTISNNYPQYLDFHFGKILFDLSFLKEAKKHLLLYLQSNPDDAETLLMLAKIAYWQGKSSSDILQKINIVLKNEPIHTEALKLREEILLNFGPELSITGSSFRDSQPLHGYRISTHLKFYKNSLLQPSIEVHTHQYTAGQQAIMTSLSNKINLSKSKTEIELRGGLADNSWSNDIIPTWALSLKQKTFKNLDFSLGANQSPYLYTKASLGKNVMPMIMTSSLGKESGNGLTGKIMGQQWTFNDENKIRIITAWLLYPVVDHPSLSFNMGYAFTIADSDKNRFVLEESSLLEMPAHFGQVLPGVFDPYFTPQNQRVHAALGKIELQLGQKIRYSLNGNIGIYARIDNPNYVYYGVPDITLPDKNPKKSLPNPQIEDITSEDIYKIYVPTKYFPLDLRSKVTLAVNKKLTLHTEYTYIETVFFNCHEVSIGLKWKIVNNDLK